MSANKLKLQKRLAMELMKVGQRKVWLDPSKKEELAKARTRAAIRELIEEGVIRRKPQRYGQKWVMPPQYMSRYRQRLLYDTRVRFKPKKAREKPSSGKRYLDSKYWLKEKT